MVLRVVHQSMYTAFRVASRCVLRDHQCERLKSVEAAQRRPAGANERGRTSTGVNDTTLTTLPSRAKDETRLSPPSEVPSPTTHCQSWRESLRCDMHGAGQCKVSGRVRSRGYLRPDGIVYIYSGSMYLCLACLGLFRPANELDFLSQGCNSSQLRNCVFLLYHLPSTLLDPSEEPY